VYAKPAQPRQIGDGTPAALGADMSNKPFLALLGVVLLGTPAFAKVADSTTKAASKKPAADSQSQVTARRVAPTGDKRDSGKTALSESQVDEVVKSKLGEVQTCWTGLPEDKRKADTNIVLKLEIDDNGEVQTVDVNGKIADEAQRCIAVAAAAWEFPVTDVKIDAAYFEYALALRAK
jgi:hypothetical protein